VLLDLFGQPGVPAAEPAGPDRPAGEHDAQAGGAQRARRPVVDPMAGAGGPLPTAGTVSGNPSGRGTGGAASRGADLAGAATGFTYSVSLLNSIIRDLLESACPPVWVSGEVTGWKRHSSGHCYFALRDASAQLRCVIWRSDAQRLPADPEEGMEVRAFGTVTLYERRGEYQLVVRELEGLGRGGLWRLAFERLHARLTAEGLLAPERKRPVPRHPAAVGVVTSASGAAVQDIVHVLRRRAPWTRVVMAPARVQGEGAAVDVARAIELCGRYGDVDVLIVGRGGGSKDDLWAFNDEAIARAIAACPVPVISAVGHETDVTIADLVADLRAPTPSAAAEAAVPDRGAIERALAEMGERLERAAGRALGRARQNVERAHAALEDGIDALVRARRERLVRVGARLEALSPLSVLARGYAVPLARDGRVLRRSAELPAGTAFGLRVVDATVPCRVEGPPALEDAERAGTREAPAASPRTVASDPRGGGNNDG
jgi:exodeoxyribonuclease VII large subunit